MNALVNFLAFHVLWVAIVWGATRGVDWLGPVLLLAWTPVHLCHSRTARSDLGLLVALGLLGPILDTLLMHAGLLQFRGLSPFPGYAPFWMMALWANFALTLNHSLSWIRRSTAAAAMFGALAGPLAYYAGAAMGAAVLTEPVWLPLLVLAGTWGVTLAVIARRLRWSDDAARAAV